MIDCFCLLYILAISLQLSGAVLLLKRFGSIKVTREDLIKSFAMSRAIHQDNFSDPPQISYNTQSFKAECKDVYLNKFAFGYISAGYLIGVLGEVNAENRLFAVICVAIFSFLIVRLSYCAVEKIANNPKAADHITSEELIALDIKPDDESIEEKFIVDLD